MVRFIQQEASEKASEIKLKADEEFNIEKLRMVEAEKQKIRQEYERKEKQVEVQKRMCAAARQPSPAPTAPAASRFGGCSRECTPCCRCCRAHCPPRAMGGKGVRGVGGGAAAEPRPYARPPAVLSPTRSDTRG